MDTKLTLMLNKRIIDRAKAYARRHHKSLSGMVENYFKTLTDPGRSAEESNTPLVEEISGVLKLPSGFDLKKDRLRHLEARHR